MLVTTHVRKLTRSGRIGLLALVLLAAVLAALASSGPASAAPAGATGYAFNQVSGIASAASSDVSISEYTTVSRSRAQIWINGKPTCAVFGHGVITWCGVASGNGTTTLNTGLNYQAYQGTTLHKYYLRFDLYSSGQCVVSQGNFNGYYGLICRN